MNNLQIIEYAGIRVLTTKQLAGMYGASEKHIKQNYANNKDKFASGKHFILLLGEDLKAFKNKVENFDLVENKAARLYLWTEKGALLHAKSLNTDKAWEVYDYLVDFYFRAKERQQALERQMEERGELVVDAPENIRIIEAANRVKDDLTCVRILLEQCSKFVTRDEYNRRRQQALEAVEIVRRDMLQFAITDPREVRKVM